MNIKPGELWVADIPFTNASSSKKRPVLILWKDGDDVVVSAVTSSNPRTETDITLSKWEESGLKVPSTVRLSRLDCIENTLLIAKLGNISADDSKLIKDIWSKYVYPKF